MTCFLQLPSLFILKSILPTVTPLPSTPFWDGNTGEKTYLKWWEILQGLAWPLETRNGHELICTHMSFWCSLNDLVCYKVVNNALVMVKSGQWQTLALLGSVLIAMVLYHCSSLMETIAGDVGWYHNYLYGILLYVYEWSAMHTVLEICIVMYQLLLSYSWKVWLLYHAYAEPWEKKVTGEIEFQLTKWVVVTVKVKQNLEGLTDSITRRVI